MRFRIHPEAVQEADGAADWYGARDGRLGIEFSRMYSMLVREIYLHPRRYPLAEDSPEGSNVETSYRSDDFRTESFTRSSTTTFSSLRSRTIINAHSTGLTGWKIL